MWSTKARTSAGEDEDENGQVVDEGKDELSLRGYAGSDAGQRGGMNRKLYLLERACL